MPSQFSLGFDREGPFVRSCLEDGYWSGVEPSCSKPRPLLPGLLDDNTVDGTKNVRAGYGSRSKGANRRGERPGDDDESTDTSSVGTWIGVVLGLIVVIGLLVLGVYFYRKQRAIATKPPPYTNGGRSAGGVGGAGANGRNGSTDYVMSGVYGGGAGGAGGAGTGGPPPVPTISGPIANNGAASLNGAAVAGSSTGPALPGRPAGGLIGQRPPPPIQMYSMDDSGGSGGGVIGGGGADLGGDVRGPIYDTINEDHSSAASGSGYSGVGGGRGGGGGSGSEHYHNGSSTFGTPIASAGNGSGGGYPPPLPPGGAGRTNAGYSGHEYDVPEGQERPPGQPASRSASSVGAVTINGIAV